MAIFLRNGAETYRALLERNGNSLILDIPQSLPHVYGNPDMLLHVLSNLLSNSNRHTRNGEITVSASLDNGQWVVNNEKERSQGDSQLSTVNSQLVIVSIADTGSGINPEILPTVFQRGVSESGTGLGLSICKTAIEGHNGTISIESKLGQGTKITFALPVHKNLGEGYKNE